MKRTVINYQTSFMPYSKGIRLFKNILNDIFKNEPGYEKIHFKSRKTDDIDNELIDYFKHHGYLNERISFHLDELNNPTFPLRVSYMPSKEKFLSAELYYEGNRVCVHIFLEGSLDDTKDSYYVIAINSALVQSLPIIIDNETDKVLKDYRFSLDPGLVDNDLPGIFKKYSLYCTKAVIIKEED